MKNKTTRFLVASAVFMTAFCVLIFTFQAVHMGERSTEAIGDLGNFYISGISEQMARHFGTAIELRMSQISAMADSVPSKGMKRSAMRINLTYSARARGFEYLGLYSSDGELEMLYGNQLTVDNPDSFAESLTRGEQTMSMAKDKGGGEAILMGVPAAYPMAGAKTSIALVAGLPTSYIRDTLSPDASDLPVYYVIIKEDASFILRSSNIHDSDFFERIRNHYGELDGKDAERYIDELSEAMAEKKSYGSEFLLDGERRFLYCTSLPYSDWFMVMFLPYGRLNKTVDTLGSQWTATAVGGCILALFAFFLIFLRYFFLARSHMRELDEARKVAEESSRAKSEFLSNMSHDIRTPMNGIVGMTAIASANIDNTSQVQNCLKKIELSSKHLLGLVNDILDMSKIESGKLTLSFEQVSLQDTIQNIVDMVQSQTTLKKQSLNAYVNDEMAQNVYCDGVRLNQIILNLVGNAIKFTPEGGSVRISLFEEPSKKGPAYVKVHLYVKDDGIGMTDEFKEKIFESFAREDNARVQKTEGSGLGMAITKYIVDAMNGTIEVESEPGKGSEFHVALDLEKAPASEEQMRLPAWEALVADDDELLRESALAGLGALGVAAVWASNGADAVKAAKERKEEGRMFDLAILDWRLPDMTGVEAARDIKKYCKDGVPIILTSSYDWQDLEEDAKGAGISGFIKKPLFRSNLYYCLKQYDKSAGENEAKEEDRTRSCRGRRFLIAEDNDLNWEIAYELISALGANVERAENGKACVEKFEQSPPKYYDAIIMDIRMPVMTGYEAAKAIRGLGRSDAGDIPIIAMSADAFSDDVEKSLECGMNAHVAKPIDMDELVKALEKYLRPARDA